MCDVQRRWIPFIPAPDKILNQHWSWGTKHWPWRSISQLLCLNEGSGEYDSGDFNCIGCVWYHCQYSPWILNNGVALDCCLAESPGPAWLLVELCYQPIPLLSYSQTDPVQFDWKYLKKRGASSLSSVPLQSLFLSSSLSSAHQWLSLCSHPALRVNGSKILRDTTSQNLP